VTLRNRVSVVAALGVLVVVAAVSGVLYLSYAASLHSRVDPALVDAAQQAAGIAQRVKQSAATDKRSGNDPALDLTVTVGSIEVQLFPGPVDAGQSTRFGPLDGRDVAVAERTEPAYVAERRDGGQRFRVYTAAGPGPSSIPLVRTSRAVNADDAALRTAAVLLAGLTVAAAGVTYSVARLTAGRVLRPIAELTAAAEHVAATRDLSARLGATGTKDEVGRLGSSFDTMLAALHDSVTAQRQLVADASHELRTPLTSLTTNLDLLEDGAGLADPHAPALVRAAREQAAELDQLISEAVHRVRQRAPHAAIVADLEPCLVHVDPAGVDHAIGNLIDNAIKWNPPDIAVRVVVADAHVSVTDHGPGIPDEDLPHIFERFYRAPAARGMPGAGLGLAIVARIAQANDATVDVRTGVDGSTFTLAFPPYPRAAEVPLGKED